MKLKYSIDKEGLYNELMGLRSDEGPKSGWGRFIKTDNQALKSFFDNYLVIEHEDLYDNGMGHLAVGSRFDETDYFLQRTYTKAQFSKLFDIYIKDAINNTGLYEGFNNKF